MNVFTPPFNGITATATTTTSTVSLPPIEAGSSQYPMRVRIAASAPVVIRIYGDATSNSMLIGPGDATMVKTYGCNAVSMQALSGTARVNIQAIPDAFWLSGFVPFSPATLFSAGEQGAWYDPSDLSTLFQDSAGTTPVTAVGQPVGTMLDKRLGLVLGPDLAADNGAFTSGQGTWSESVGGTWTFTGGVASHLPTSASSNIRLDVLTIGKFYELSLTVVSVTVGGVTPFLGLGTPTKLLSAPGRYTTKGICTTNGVIYLDVPANSDVVVDDVSVREIPGNHAIQPTAINRPVLSARVNLLTKTEQFDDAVWSKSTGTSITANYGLAPDGTRTAARVILPAGQSDVRQTKASPGTNTISSWVKGVAGETVAFLINSVGAPSNFTFTGAWQQITRADSVNPAEFLVFGTYSGATARDFLVWHPQLETGTVATRYQRVNTATDYDTVGFPSYLAFNGSNSFMQTGAIDLTATDKITVVAGVRKLSDVRGQIFLELSANSNSVNTFGIYAGNVSSASGAYWSGLSSGSAQTVVQAAKQASPVSEVISMTAGISTPVLSLAVNAGEPVTSPANQGTGNYSNNPIYIGARGGTGLFFNGNFYSLIVRGALSSPGQIISAETYANSKTGAY